MLIEVRVFEAFIFFRQQQHAFADTNVAWLLHKSFQWMDLVIRQDNTIRRLYWTNESMGEHRYVV